MIESNSETVTSRTTLPLYESEVSNSTTINCDHYGNMTIFGSINNINSNNDCIYSITTLDSNRVVFGGHSQRADGSSDCILGLATVSGTNLTVDKIIIFSDNNDVIYGITALDSNRVVFGGYSMIRGNSNNTRYDYMLGLATVSGITLTVDNVVMFGDNIENCIQCITVLDNNRIVFGGYNYNYHNTKWDCILGLATVSGTNLTVDKIVMFGTSMKNMIQCVTAIDRSRVVFGGYDYNECVIGLATVSENSLIIDNKIKFGYGNNSNNVIYDITALDSNWVVFGGYLSKTGNLDNYNCMFGRATISGNSITINNILMFGGNGVDIIQNVEALGSSRVVFGGYSRPSLTSNDYDCIFGLATVNRNSITIDSVIKFGGNKDDCIYGITTLDSNRVVFGGYSSSSPNVGSGDCMLFNLSDLNYETVLADPVGWKLQKWNIIVEDFTAKNERVWEVTVNIISYTIYARNFTPNTWDVIVSNFKF